MARRYTYSTTIGLDLHGELDVTVRYECHDHELVERIEVAVIDGAIGPFDDHLAAAVVRELEARHADAMIQQAIEDDAEARVEVAERIQERKSELAGWF